MTLTLSRCTCEEEIPVPVCTCSMADLLEMAVKLINQQEKILKEGDSVKEALEMRVRKNVINPHLRLETFQTNFGSSMTVTVSNFSKSALSAVRTSTAAGEV